MALEAEAPDVIRVLLVDDERMVCNYLTTILEQAPDIQVVGAEYDGAAAVDAAMRLRPDVVLMDLHMPGASGLVAIARIRQLQVPTRVIALTVFESDCSVRQAMQAGASGFLLKSTAPRDLVNLVRVAAQGQVVLSPWAADRLLAAGMEDSRAAQARQRLGCLSAREFDVLELLGQGRSNAEIGTALYLTEATIKGYVSRILAKLDCENRTQAGILAQWARGSRRSGSAGDLAESAS